MGNSKLPQVGIIGAGIGGLSTAIALRRAGWECEVFERSSFKNETGAAITVTPNATRCLDRWGFDFKRARPTENRQFRLMSAQDLKVLYRQDYLNLDQQFGYKSWFFHRVDLHKGLLDLAVEPGQEEEIPAKIRLSCEVKEVDFEGGKIVLADGSCIAKDLIVVADGAHSSIVNQFSGGSSTLKPSKRSIYRCLIPMDKIMSDPAIRSIYEDQEPGFLGITDRIDDVLFANYACRNNEVLNCAVVHDSRVHQGENEITSWNEPVSLDDILKTIHNFHPSVKRIVELAANGESDIKVHNLMIRDALSSFVRHTTVVVGDAAHVMLPTHAAGGAVTIESAACLGFAGITAPGVEEEVRKYYHGPVPEPGSIPWSAENRAIWFDYDVFEETTKRLGGEVSGA
ncbi:hypothetical protein FKW77_001913 [Venturia effusa]|uniref:FAD-binding domain-containing protein n=1 Tax=Venturia effusa TaxID=50376 RepID=A0A517LBZ1_9PEZI|nr:hypothetical protein FKW77_001913 [Venturia effusa]